MSLEGHAHAAEQSYRRITAQPFHKSVAFSEQQVYRRIVGDGLRRTPRALMLKMLNLWFRHRSSNKPLAPGFEALAKALNVCEKSIQRAMKHLEKLGLVRFLFGGNGAGRLCRYAVDLTKIREVLAPDMIVEAEPKKADSLAQPLYIELKRGTIGRAWLFRSGLVGRVDLFRHRLARCLLLDARATWRKFAPPIRKREPGLPGNPVTSTTPDSHLLSSVRQK